MLIEEKGRYVDPYFSFTRQQWKRLASSQSVDLNEVDLARLSGVNEVVSLPEIVEVYLPLSHLIRLHIDQARRLHSDVCHYLNNDEPRVPYIIGVAGSVASGKSTTSRVLQELLSSDHGLKVKVVGTDGFLFPNAVLESKGLMDRKGFPDSYNLDALLRFLFDLKAGKEGLTVPVYSHHLYDILPNQPDEIGSVDVVILEGLNILQTGASAVEQQRVFVSDFLDFTVFVDAPVEYVKRWYIDRVVAFSQGPMRDPDAYFHALSTLSESAVTEYAATVWNEINAVNLVENILPFRYRARCVLYKGENHGIDHILLRRL